MAKSRTGGDVGSLPEPTTWARAVVLGTGILGVSLSERTLAAKNVDELGRKVLEVVRAILPSARKLVEALESCVVEIGLDSDCDRLRTARSARALCEAIGTKPSRSPREVVDALAAARLETSSSAVQASLAATPETLETLEDPLVQGVLKQLAGREKADLSASKYVREARSILRQDEMRRSLSVELRMVAGAAQAYLLSGMPSAANAGALREVIEVEGSLSKSSALASVVAPADVRIAGSRTSPPMSPPRPKPSSSRSSTSKPSSKRGALTRTLTSEGVVPMTRVTVERRGAIPDKPTARAMLAEVMKEAEEKLDAAKGMVLLTVMITVDVSEKGG